MISTLFPVRAARAAALTFFMAMMAVTLMLGSVHAASFRKDKLVLKTSAGDHTIEIEVAETNEQKALGLMYRTSVPPGTGMLFPYGPGQEVTMWMRNTYSSLDMVFIKSDGTVHRIEENTEPLSERIISSRGPVSAVLELAAGESKRLKLKPGDEVIHASFKPLK
jgi:uncharacterized protein